MRVRHVALAALLALPARAHAFCGFYVAGAGTKLYNNATEVVLMRQGTTTVLSMANNYQGPPSEFAMVVPVPTVIKQDQVRTLPRDVFDKIDAQGAPRLVEYWEQDPCRPPVMEDQMVTLAGATAEDDRDEGDAVEKKPYHVKVEARFSVGEYDIEVLSAKESTGLGMWLRDHHYSIPEGAEPLLRPYIEQGMKWFVAKVNPKKVAFDPKTGMATLSPLRFFYDSPDFTLPIRLGLANSSGTQDLIVNIVAPGDTRYEAANYPNVLVPTNLTVTDGVRTRFAEFYAALFDHAIATQPHAVVTEYAWSTSNCDPCAGPVLDGNDLATIGADVLGARYQDSNNFTLTRLHARYRKDLGSDLVFRSVNPIEGGRGIPDAHGEVPTAVEHASFNNFQGRYMILHPWQGEMTCATPVRGTWGGPPAGQQQLATQAATNTAFAPRGKVELATLLAKDAPQIGVLVSNPVNPPLPKERPQACGGCQTTGGGAAALGVLIVGLALRRRRQ
jgi:MYXO-CTERM domain-containing protein